MIFLQDWGLTTSILARMTGDIVNFDDEDPDMCEKSLQNGSRVRIFRPELEAPACFTLKLYWSRVDGGAVQYSPKSKDLEPELGNVSRSRRQSRSYWDNLPGVRI